MKKLLLFILLSISGFFQLSANILETQYNSLSGTMSLVTGDVDGTLFGIGTTGQFAQEGRDGVAFMFSFDHLNVTDVAGVNLNGADIEQNSFSYGIGYIFKGDRTHFIPYFGILDAEIGVNGYSAAEYDSNTFGFMLRSILSETSVITFSVANSDVDNVSVLGTTVKTSDVQPETSFGFGIMNKISDDSTFNLGASFAEGITSFNFGLTLGF